MRRLAISLSALSLLAVPLTMPAALAQDAPPRTTSVPEDTTAPEPSAAQPRLPSAAQAAPAKPGSPVVEKIVQDDQPALHVRKRAATRRIAKHRHMARRVGPSLPRLDRPALAGVMLVAPLPPPADPPHVTVPTPAFPLESVASAYLTPPPPIVCHPTRRDPDAPDPRLYKEVPVVCEADNP